jgi:hypothetical protein
MRSATASKLSQVMRMAALALRRRHGLALRLRSVPACIEELTIAPPSTPAACRPMRRARHFPFSDQFFNSAVFYGEVGTSGSSTSFVIRYPQHTISTPIRLPLPSTELPEHRKLLFRRCRPLVLLPDCQSLMLPRLAGRAVI